VEHDHEEDLKEEEVEEKEEYQSEVEQEKEDLQHPYLSRFFLTSQSLDLSIPLSRNGSFIPSWNLQHI
jgi:hypothetical protein